MFTLDPRLAAVTASTTSLVNRLRELNLVRNRPGGHGGSDLEKATGLSEETASCVDGPRLARVFSLDEQWSLAVMCPAF
jgi:hypothetical protein